MNVDAGVVEWLKTGALYASATDAAHASKWAGSAIETTIVSTYANADDAEEEAIRQQAWLEGPLVVETHNVPGLRSDLMGRPVTITASQLGYDEGLTVFVVGVEEMVNVERTILTVLRKLT